MPNLKAFGPSVVVIRFSRLLIIADGLAARLETTS
jgi:hypothetical protein